ncbi:MAG TPA: hypothetical protein VGG43_01915, partial [Acidimicrobiales bacterium]
HQLTLPINTLQSLMQRAVNQKFLERQGGIYLVKPDHPEVSDLSNERAKVEERQRRLASALCEHAAGKGFPIENTEEALAMILSFLDKYHVSMASAIDVPPQMEHGPVEMTRDQPDRSLLITADFIEKAVSEGGVEADAIQEMLEGFVLQNALLLKDISTADRKFRHLRVFFDSGLVLAALGYKGDAAKLATVEMMSLLQDTGATVEVFERTIDEIKGILVVYENGLGSSQGRENLRKTELTRYFLANQYSPSDIRTISSTINRTLRDLGFNIRELPVHKVQFTLNEDDLSERLAGAGGVKSEPRVVHDVNSVAAVLTLRKGRVSDSLDTAAAVFVTDNWMTFKTVQEWYEAESPGSIPPIIHYLLLSNLAWLKRPASATKLKLQELVALCVAALRPSRRTWDAFLGNMKRLQESGDLSSDEVTAVVANGLTENLLAEQEMEDTFDASTTSEIVERVKLAHQAQAAIELQDAQAKVQNVEATLGNVRQRSRSIAKYVAWTVVIVLASCCIVGAALTTIQAVGGHVPWLPIVLIVVPGGLYGLTGVLAGWNLKADRRRVEDSVAKMIAKWFGIT